MKIFYHPRSPFHFGLYLQSIFHFAASIKKNYFIIIIFILVFNPAEAQDYRSTTTLLSPIPQEEQAKLSVYAATKFKQLEQDEQFKQVQLVKVGNLAKIQKKGVLTFKIPGTEKTSTFFSREVTAESENDFKWVGVSENNMETAIFMSEKGKVYGTFSSGKRHFQLFSIEEGISVLIEERTDLINSCGADGKNPIIIDEPFQQSIEGDKKAARQGVCTEPIRVLVLYTAAAQSSVGDINQTINTSIQQFNTTISNSGLSYPQTNQLQLAGSQLITFASNSPEGTTFIDEAVTRVRDNTDVQNLRNQYGADLVVCLVEQVYQGDAIGSVGAIPASNVNYCAVVRAPFSSSPNFYTFTHEVGHLLGGRHQNDSGTPAYSHGYQFFTNPPAPATSVQVRTMMHTFASSERIMHFANPNINFNGSPTGTTASNNVARAISENSPNLVNFRPSVTQSFSAYIDGPSDIYQSGYYSWEAITFCRGWLSASWSTSYDGFNYGPTLSGGDALNYLLVDNNNYYEPFYLKCTFVTDQNQTVSVTKYINVNLSTGWRLSVADNTKAGIHETKLSSIYPNPSENSVTIDYSLDKDSDVAIEIIDMEGRSHLKRLIKSVPFGENKEEMDVTHLVNGVYVCRIKLGDKELNKRFIVSK